MDEDEDGEIVVWTRTGRDDVAMGVGVSHWSLVDWYSKVK